MAQGKDSFGGMGMPIVGNVTLSGETVADDVLTIVGADSQSGDFLVLKSSGGTEHLYVEDDGVTNWNIAKTAADNAVAITLTNAGTFTSGYHQGLYVNQTATGKFTTGGSQINSLAVDLMLGGEIGCEAEGLYVYIGQAATTTLTSANVSGISVFVASLGTSPPSTRCGLQLHMQGVTEASSQDAFIICRSEDSAQVTNALYFQGTNQPTYFLRTNNVTTGMVQTATAAGTQDKVLIVDLNGSTYWIPMYAASA